MRPRVLIIYVIVGFLSFLYPEILFARDAPITTAWSSSVCPGVMAIVPVTVTNFTSVGAITLRLDYDPTHLLFDSISNLYPSISGAAINHIIVSSTLAKILIVWASINGLTLPDSTKLLDLNFILVTGSPEISFNNTANGGGDCEYADENGVTLNDLPSDMFYINSVIENLGVEPAESLTGVDSLCAGTNNVAYSVPPVVNATGYLWSVPTGSTIVSGENTSSIVVDYSTAAESGVITVAGTNACGTGTSSTLPVTIFPLPGAAGIITGTEIVCAGANDIFYSVPTIDNATSYDWTLPSEAVITSGSTTNQILVTFGGTPGTGLISVNGINECGSGPVSTDFLVTMVNPMDTPVVTASGPMLTSSITTGNQWYYEGTGAITGATGQTYLATTTGWYWTIVVGEGCPILESNHVYVLFTGQGEFQDNNLNVYPVPNDGRFNVTFALPSPETYTVLVYNQLGTKIFECYDIPVLGTSERQIDIRPAASGIYSVVFLCNKHKIMRKVLVK